jgi:hypothetical protein
VQLLSVTVSLLKMVLFVDLMAALGGQSSIPALVPVGAFLYHIKKFAAFRDGNRV